MAQAVTTLHPPTYVATIANPITGTVVSLVPPFPYYNPVALVAFQSSFSRWCATNHAAGQDLTVYAIKQSNWPDSDAIMPGQTSAPAPTPTAAP